jgi:hypothetical protein
MALTNSVEAEHNRILLHIRFEIMKVSSFLSLRTLGAQTLRFEDNEPTTVTARKLEHQRLLIVLKSETDADTLPTMPVRMAELGIR